MITAASAGKLFVLSSMIKAALVLPSTTQTAVVGDGWGAGNVGGDSAEGLFSTAAVSLTGAVAIGNGDTGDGCDLTSAASAEVDKEPAETIGGF